MEKEKFQAILVLLVPQVVSLISLRYSYDELTAARDFYESTLYSRLEMEETKLWHLSPEALFQMYDEEKRTGTITFPEEA